MKKKAAKRSLKVNPKKKFPNFHQVQKRRVQRKTAPVPALVPAQVIAIVKTRRRKRRQEKKRIRQKKREEKPRKRRKKQKTKRKRGEKKRRSE